MSNETQPSNGAQDGPETTDSSSTDTSLEEVAAANDRLRERVDDLERMVSEIHGAIVPDEWAAETASTPEKSDNEAATVLPSGGQTYKVRGKLNDSNGGVGVFGYNTAGSGTTYGVWGEVDSSNGHGLYTPNDAKVDGDLEVSRVQAEGDLTLDRDGNDEFRDLTFGQNSGELFYNPSGSGYLSGDRLLGISLGDVLYLGQSAEIAFTEFGFEGTMQRTAGPVAKGYINADASIANGVYIDSVAWTGSHYEITLAHDDYWFDEYVTSVTSLAGDKNITWGVTSSSPQLWIEPSDGNQHDFMFVTHKLVVGQASTSSVSGDDVEVAEGNIERSSTEEVDNTSP